MHVLFCLTTLNSNALPSDEFEYCTYINEATFEPTMSVIADEPQSCIKHGLVHEASGNTL